MPVAAEGAEAAGVSASRPSSPLLGGAPSSTAGAGTCLGAFRASSRSLNVGSFGSFRTALVAHSAPHHRSCGKGTSLVVSLQEDVVDPDASPSPVGTWTRCPSSTRPRTYRCAFSGSAVSRSSRTLYVFLGYGPSPGRAGSRCLISETSDMTNGRSSP